MANYKTGAQRYNDRMDKIFAKSEELGHHSLHGSKEKVAKKMKTISAKPDSAYQAKSGKLISYGGERGVKSKHFGGTYHQDL